GGVVEGGVAVGGARCRTEGWRVAFFGEFRGLLLALPGVHAAGGAANLHLGNSHWGSSIQREGKDADSNSDTENPRVSVNVITPGYLDARGLFVVGVRERPPAPQRPRASRSSTRRRRGSCGPTRIRSASAGGSARGTPPA